MKRTVLFGLALLALGVAACESIGPDDVAILSLTARTGTLQVGDTMTMRVQAATGSGAAIPNAEIDLSFSTTDASVASIDASTGKVTATGPGSATITATAGAKSNVYGLNVVPKP